MGIGTLPKVNRDRTLEHVDSLLILAAFNLLVLAAFKPLIVVAFIRIVLPAFPH